jgi:hypothetical protein
VIDGGGVFGAVELNIVPPGTDPLSAIALRAEAETDALGWGGERDAALQWFWLYDQGQLSGGGNLRGIGMGLAEVGMDLDGKHPVVLLDYLARHVKPSRDLIGFVLVQECWIATWAGGDEENKARILAAAERREIWRQPDRLEARVAQVQMLTGQTRAVLRIRGQEPQLVGQLPGDVDSLVANGMRQLADTLRLRKYGRRG